MTSSDRVRPGLVARASPPGPAGARGTTSGRGRPGTVVGGRGEQREVDLEGRAPARRATDAPRRPSRTRPRRSAEHARGAAGCRNGSVAGSKASGDAERARQRLQHALDGEEVGGGGSPRPTTAAATAPVSSAATCVRSSGSAAPPTPARPASPPAGPSARHARPVAPHGRYTVPISNSRTSGMPAPRVGLRRGQQRARAARCA